MSVIASLLERDIVTELDGSLDGIQTSRSREEKRELAGSEVLKTRRYGGVEGKGHGGASGEEIR